MKLEDLIENLRTVEPCPACEKFYREDGIGFMNCPECGNTQKIYKRISRADLARMLPEVQQANLPKKLLEFENIIKIDQRKVRSWVGSGVYVGLPKHWRDSMNVAIKNTVNIYAVAGKENRKLLVLEFLKKNKRRTKA